MARGSADRYFQAEIGDSLKLVPEESKDRYHIKGQFLVCFISLLGGVRAAIGYVGAKNLPEFSEKAQFVRITSASLIEGHPHDVKITKESPNYPGGI